ncbi:MAG TPA: FAD-dependent oxidoreductase, partial [Spirochaetota bacterium]|nr:FAD-dependent oxidoreductase [Spirochaetota bacterium]HRS64138.1 FAD-dependent oxidoreductase [Spirochaetota bacterium]
MQRKKIVVIGGSAAGPKAAARARRLDEHAEITIIQKAPDLSMASCGYPYYVGGTFNDRNMLICTPTGVIRDPNYYLNAKGIVARTETEAVKIDRNSKTVTIRDLKTGKEEEIKYDKLIIATGGVPRKVPVPGAELQGITTLQSMQDADFLRKIRDEKKVKKAVIVGGGLIGIEAAEALQLAGIEITIVEMLPQILTFLDWEIAKVVENHIRSKGANVILENGVAEFLGENGRLTGVKLQNGTELPCELAVVAIGVNPNVQLAKDAGIAIGQSGAIAVDKYMQTSDPDIYAIGDCVES